MALVAVLPGVAVHMCACSCLLAHTSSLYFVLCWCHRGFKVPLQEKCREDIHEGEKENKML